MSPVIAEEEAVARGERLFHAAGGCGCHAGVEAGRATGTEGDLGGGRAIETPFGTFHATNITPDADSGLGGWSEEDFVRAMRLGRAPDGTRYYPVFPYPAFTRITDDDLVDLWAYLRSLPPVARANRPHELDFPYSLRLSATLWQLLFFSSGAFEPDGSAPDLINNGRYLATALGHCQECHTPRTALGTLDEAMYLAGAAEGPEGELAPNITPDDATGIGEWSRPDLTWFLRTGFKPDGDDTQGLMSELIEHGYGKMVQADLEAVAAYMESVPAIENRVTVDQD